MELRLREIRVSRSGVCWDVILSTDNGMIPSRNVIYAHAQNFVANNELLLSILSAFAQCALSLHAPRNPWCFQSVCSSRTVCRSYQ